MYERREIYNKFEKVTQNKTWVKPGTYRLHGELEEGKLLIL